MGKCNEAITAYTEALEMDKLNINFNSTVYCNRAAAKMRKKDFKARKKILKSPIYNYIMWKNVLGQCLFRISLRQRWKAVSLR